MEDPAEFSKHNKNTIRDAAELLAKYRDSFQWLDGPEDILEVGCANGNITGEVVYEFVEGHVDKLIGCDISRKAVEIARGLHRKPKLSFAEIDITEDRLWEKHENRFGHIVSFYTFHLIGHPERWSENLFRMLKPKGQLFATLLLSPHPFPLAAKAQRREKSAPWAKYMEDVPDLFADYGENPVENVKGIFKDAGFAIDVAEVNRLISVYPTFENLSATLLAVNNFQKRIPEEIRTAYVEDFLKKVDENVQRDDDGSYYYFKNVLVIIATKPEGS